MKKTLLFLFWVILAFIWWGLFEILHVIVTDRATKVGKYLINKLHESI